MRNEFRKELLDNLSKLSCELGNSSNFNAYPQMQYVFFNLGSTIDVMAKSIMREEIEDMLYGRTPWAKLYEMMTGHAVKLEPLMVGGVLPDSFSSYYGVPLKQIVDYWFKYRGKTLPSDHTVSASFGIDNWTVAVNFETFSATAETLLNDMVITIDDITMALAHVNCPLFNEPIKIMMAEGWLNTLRQGVYNRFVKPEDLNLDWFNPETFIGERFVGKFNEPLVETPDDHSFVQLLNLFRAFEFGKHSRNWVDVELNEDYIVRLRSKEHWEVHGGYTISIEIVYHVLKNDDGSPRPMSFANWRSHPLLVNDIIDNVDRLIDQALTVHYAEINGG